MSSTRFAGWVPGRAVAVAVIVAFILAPLVVVVIESFNAAGYLVFPPRGLSTRWYSKVLDNPELMKSFLLSLRLAAASVGIGVAVATLGAVTLWRLRGGPVMRTLEQLLFAPLFVPSVVLGLMFLLAARSTGLGGTFTGLLAAHSVLVVPFIVRNVLAGLVAIDESILHASRSLGASRTRTFVTIVLPLIRRHLVAGSVLGFIISFDETMVTLFLIGPGLVTLPVYIFSYVQHSADPGVAALSTLLIALSISCLIILMRVSSPDRLFGGGGRR